MERRALTLAVSAALVVGIVAGGSQLSVPYVGLAPGPVTDTLGSVDGQPLIKISGRRTFPTSGQLDLTTVAVHDRVDLATAVRYWFDDRLAIVPREVIYPEDKSEDEVEEEVRREMVESQEAAKAAALRQLRIPFDVEVVIDKVLPGKPAATSLRAGDVLLRVDGTAVAGPEGLRTAIRRRPPGQPVRLTYRRGTATSETTLVTVPSEDMERRATIGVEISSKLRPPFTVEIRLEEVGGPSAGLMFALGIYDRLTDGSLTGGAHVAGTGTIDESGTVGPIGGIQQKLVAAREAGASHFLTPRGNLEEASAAVPDGLRLEPVGTLAEAIAALDRIRRSAS